MKDQIYLNMVKEYSNFSKCQFTKVGCIAVNENGRIVATGVNGTLSGLDNCCDHSFHSREDHIKYTRENELHAEANMILELAISGITFSNLSIYTTISPCFECLKLILGLTRTKGENKIKIDKIVFENKYHRLTEEDLNWMKEKALSVGTKLLSIEEAENEFCTTPHGLQER